MEFPLAWQTFRRLPKHPDWRWEYFDGAVHLSHRPRPIALVRRTAAPVPVSGQHHVRPLQPSDRTALRELLWTVWRPEDPYRTLENDVEAREQLTLDLDQSLVQGRWPIGVVVPTADGLQGAAMVLPDVDDQPTLSWLSVHEDHRLSGMATAMLAAIVTSVQAAGHPELRSMVSGTSAASLRWHWTRGFTPLPPRPWERRMIGGGGVTFREHGSMGT